MTDPMMSLQSLLEKSSDADLLRGMIGFAAERLMELEVEGLTEAGAGIIGFVPVDVATSALLEQPAPPGEAADWVIEIGVAGGRSLKVLSSLPTVELRRLIRAVEDA